MISLKDTLISDEIASEFFVCNIEKCKGACCVEGDLGAPLEEDELPILDEIYEEVKPYLTPKAIEVIEKEGTYILDFEGEYSTPTINNRECVYAIYDENKILKCGIEQAYIDGKIDYKKPISCHLYPIRAQKYEKFTALNYDRWSICSDACSFGSELQVPVYKFLEEPLVRKFGEDWYQELCKLIEK